MDDRRGVPLIADLAAAYRNEPIGLRRAGPRSGFFIALEGGEGAGKSTQAEQLAGWLRAKGHEVVLTFEPGATEVGRRLRAVLLDHHDATGTAHPALSPRTEALLFAADRAEHVNAVVVPALERGAIVLTDRYIDSSVAYQGAGRDLGTEAVRDINEWATSGLQPDLTVLLDVDPVLGRRRRTAGDAAEDRLESEADDFHARIRAAFLDLAAARPENYLVLPARLPAEELAARILDRVEALLPIAPSRTA
jgi:dTMP kinase